MDVSKAKCLIATICDQAYVIRSWRSCACQTLLSQNTLTCQSIWWQILKIRQPEVLGLRKDLPLKSHDSLSNYLTGQADFTYAVRTSQKLWLFCLFDRCAVQCATLLWFCFTYFSAWLQYQTGEGWEYQEASWLSPGGQSPVHRPVEWAQRRERGQRKGAILLRWKTRSSH